jgi:hypothetical protein
LTWALNVFQPLEIDEQNLNMDTWQASAQCGVSYQTLRLCPVNLTGASGQLGQYPFVTLTALFVLVTYKYVVAGSWGFLLAFLSS